MLNTTECLDLFSAPFNLQGGKSMDKELVTYSDEPEGILGPFWNILETDFLEVVAKQTNLK